MAHQSISTIPELLLLAALVAIAARRIHVPYTVALVLTGLAIGAGDFLSVFLTPDLILLVFLPPLLFEGALAMDLTELRRRWLGTGAITVVGVLITAVATALLLWWFTPLDLKLAVLLAVMLSATDPVSVIATFREHEAPNGLRTLVEGESIFNDGLAIVLFEVALVEAFPGGAATSAGHVIYDVLKSIGIGIITGLVSGYLIHQLMRPVWDHMVEVMLSIVLAYGSYLLADDLGGSGPIAVAVAALFVGNYSPGQAMSPRTQHTLTDFWEIVAFLINSALFLLIGLDVRTRHLAEPDVLLTILVASIGLLAGRALAVYGVLGPIGKFRGEPAIPRAWLHVAFWGGLRGSVPIALALTLVDEQTQFAGMDAQAIVFGAVVVSLVLQGLTFGPLLRRTGIAQGEQDAVEAPQQVSA